MKITKEYYINHKHSIEPHYLTLAEELTQQMLDCMDWEKVDAQEVIALWLKVNELRCTKE